MSLIKRLCRDRAGSSAAELALLAPLFSLALLAAFDLSLGFSQRLKLVSAADRAATLASAPGHVRTDYDFLASEAERASNVRGATAVVGNWLECDGVRQAAGVALCADGARFARYVEIDVSAIYDPLFNYGGLIPLRALTIRGKARVRIQ